MHRRLIQFIFILIALLFAMDAKAGIIIKPVHNFGLVGYWNFDEGAGGTANDKSGYGNHGAWYGTGSHWANGKIGQGGNFNGSDDYVNIGTSSELQPSNLTVSLWVKRTAAWNGGSGKTFVWAKEDSRQCEDTGWYLDSWDDAENHEAFNLVVDGCNYFRITDYPDNVFPLNQWTHVAASFNSTTNVGALYINGISRSIDTIGSPDSITGTADSKTIGTRGTIGPYFLNGQIDEIRIYNRVLSASEVERLYKLSQPKFGINRLGPVSDDNPSNAVIGLVRENCAGYSNCSTSLSAWQTYMLTGGGITWGECPQGDLPCVDKVAVAKIDGPWAAADTTAVTIDGWTTDATRYIKIYTTAEARHNGKWDEGKYRLIITGAHGIYINEGNVRIDGLQVSVTPSSYYDGIVFQSTGTSNNDFRVSNNIIKAINSAANWPAGIELWDSGSGTFRAWNNIIYDFNYGTVNFGIVMADNAGGYTGYVYNNTIHNCIKGLFRDAGTLVAINNIVKGSGDTNAYVGTFSDSDYNATDGTDTDDGGAHSRTSQTFNFADEANDDFHLAPADTGARDYGTSNPGSGLFSNDIDRQNRSVPWDIGADEALVSKISASQNNQLTNGLVGLWSFNGPDIDGNEAYDRSGQGNTGTITGATKTIGQVGQALDFDGTDDQISVANNDTLDGIDQVSISLWFYPRVMSAEWRIIAGKGTYAENYGLWQSGANFVTVFDNGGWKNHPTVNGYAVNQWYHLVMVIDNINDTARIYVNGVDDTQTPSETSDMVTNETAFLIAPDYGGYRPNGIIDEVRIYNRVLTAQEILRLYNLGR